MVNNKIQAAEENLIHVYNRFPVVLDHGEGMYLYDTDGKEYLDLETYRAIMKEIQKETLTKGKPLYMAVRCGITRSTKGPEMDSVATILPVSELTGRIKATMEKAGMA